MIRIQTCVTVIWPDGEEVTECGDDPDDPPPSDDPPPATCDPQTSITSCDDDGGGSTGGGSTPCTSCEPDAPPAEAPEGINQEDYEKLNSAEKRLC